MTSIAQIAARAPYHFPPGTKLLEMYNVERVRGYLEKNLGASRKETCRALSLHPRTVAKAIVKIRSGA